jgi:hypothetical protein
MIRDKGLAGVDPLREGGAKCHLPRKEGKAID